MGVDRLVMTTPQLTFPSHIYASEIREASLGEKRGGEL
jgi:hypothetical protein